MDASRGPAAHRPGQRQPARQLPTSHAGPAGPRRAAARSTPPPCTPCWTPPLERPGQRRRQPDGAVRFAADLRSATAQGAQARAGRALRLEQLDAARPLAGRADRADAPAAERLRAQVTGQQLRDPHSRPPLGPAAGPVARRHGAVRQPACATAARAGSACAWPTRSVPALAAGPAWPGRP